MFLFKVVIPETGAQVASISHHWDESQVNYNLSIKFPSRYSENGEKALLIGAAFLLVTASSISNE
jgi:hypothetical protein